MAPKCERAHPCRRKRDARQPTQRSAAPTVQVKSAPAPDPSSDVSPPRSKRNPEPIVACSPSARVTSKKPGTAKKRIGRHAEHDFAVRALRPPTNAFVRARAFARCRLRIRFLSFVSVPLLCCSVFAFVLVLVVVVVVVLGLVLARVDRARALRRVPLRKSRHRTTRPSRRALGHRSVRVTKLDVARHARRAARCARRARAMPLHRSSGSEMYAWASRRHLRDERALAAARGAFAIIELHHTRGWRLRARVKRHRRDRYTEAPRKSPHRILASLALLSANRGQTAVACASPATFIHIALCSPV